MSSACVISIHISDSKDYNCNYLHTVAKESKGKKDYATAPSNDAITDTLHTPKEKKKIVTEVNGFRRRLELLEVIATEDQLTLTRASAIAQSMEAATRQSTQMRDVLTDSPKGVGKLTMGQSNSHVLARGSGSKSAHNGINGKSNASGSAGKSDPCYRCTKRGHLPQDCKKDASCHKCHKRGHIITIRYTSISKRIDDSV